MRITDAHVSLGSQMDDKSKTCDGKAQQRNSEKNGDLARQWRLDNEDAVKAENEYIEKFGLPLTKFRQF